MLKNHNKSISKQKLCVTFNSRLRFMDTGTPDNE